MGGCSGRETVWRTDGWEEWISGRDVDSRCREGGEREEGRRKGGNLRGSITRIKSDAHDSLNIIFPLIDTHAL
jgi:hypothetical protein